MTDVFALHDPAARAFLRAELGVQEGEILFGHVGRFCEQKNHAGLLRIFAGVSRRMPNARLVLIGTGELVDSTRALAQELNLSDPGNFCRGAQGYGRAVPRHGCIFAAQFV